MRQRSKYITYCTNMELFDTCIPLSAWALPEFSLQFLLKRDIYSFNYFMLLGRYDNSKRQMSLGCRLELFICILYFCINLPFHVNNANYWRNLLFYCPHLITTIPLTVKMYVYVQCINFLVLNPLPRTFSCT